MSIDIKKLTETYRSAFDARDIATIEELLHEDCNLKDPNNWVSGSENVLELMRGIFDAYKELSFQHKAILVDENTSVIEFQLKVDRSVFIGADIIEWDGVKIKALRAYLYQE